MSRRLHALIERTTRLKHGPKGTGQDGPCEPDCVKCQLDREIESIRSGVSDDRPSIAELQSSSPCADGVCCADGRASLARAAPVLLEIAEAALAFGGELGYLQGPLSERLRAALGKVRP